MKAKMRVRANRLRQNATSRIRSGRCRYCACTDTNGCFPPCWWMDQHETVCSSRGCIDAAKFDGIRLRAALMPRRRA